MLGRDVAAFLDIVRQIIQFPAALLAPVGFPVIPLTLPSALENLRSPRRINFARGELLLLASIPRPPPASSFSRSYLDIFGAVIGFCFL